MFLAGWPTTHVSSVPIDGSASSVRIDEIQSPYDHVLDFRIAPDDSQVAFLAGPGFVGSIQELFLAPTDGSGSPRRLHRSFSPLGSVAPDFQFTPDGTAVLFRAEDQDPDAFELFLAPIGGRVAGVEGPGR